MWNIFSPELKTLIIMRSAEYKCVAIEKPYFYNANGKSHSIDYNESLTVTGVCESLLFADYCKRNNLNFDEVHYQWKNPANLPTQQMGALLIKSGIVNGKQELIMSNDLVNNYGLFKSYFGIKPESKVVLYIINNNAFETQLKKTRAISENTEGFILQAPNWENVLEQQGKRIRMKSTLTRRPRTTSENVSARILLENPDLMQSAKGLNLHDESLGVICSNEKLLNLELETINNLMQNIKKHYTWYVHFYIKDIKRQV